MSAAARVRSVGASPSAARLSDVELMRACASASCRDSWDEFVRRFNRFVCIAVVRAFSQCSGRRPGQLDPEEVSDLVQDVYLKLLERSKDGNGIFRGSSDAAVYVYIGRVAISVVVDAQRRHLARKRSRDTVSLDAVIARDGDGEFTLAATIRSPLPTPEQDAMASIFRREIAEILRCSVRGRNAARDLRIAEGYILDGAPLTEIARSEGGIGSGALKSSVRRTGARLRVEIARRERLASLRHVALT